MHIPTYVAPSHIYGPGFIPPSALKKTLCSGVLPKILTADYNEFDAEWKTYLPTMIKENTHAKAAA